MPHGGHGRSDGEADLRGDGEAMAFRPLSLLTARWEVAAGASMSARIGARQALVWDAGFSVFELESFDAGTIVLATGARFLNGRKAMRCRALRPGGRGEQSKGRRARRQSLKNAAQRFACLRKLVEAILPSHPEERPQGEARAAPDRRTRCATPKLSRIGERQGAAVADVETGMKDVSLQLGWL